MWEFGLMRTGQSTDIFFISRTRSALKRSRLAYAMTPIELLSFLSASPF